MGSSASVSAGDLPGGDLRLPVTGLRFQAHQLRALNSHVNTLWQEDQKGRISPELECAVESLVQRIVDGAGQKDPRFKCCHLIALHRGKKMRSRSLEYLVTLDSLPVLNGENPECCLEDGPVGYGKIRLTGREYDKWEEFLTPSGYLCRDKVIEKWVELIARCASARGGGGSRVLSARARALAAPYTYCYLERASPSHTGSDRRLAIVEGAAWVMVRVGAGEAEAKLALAAKVHGCTSADTTRVPLMHPLALLHYTNVQAGYYAVAVGPPTATSGERGSNWQLWNPGLEAALDAHCSDLSNVGRVAGALNALLDKMREGVYQGSVRALSRYSVQCALRVRLDRCARYSSAAARGCVSAQAHHLLLVLDDLVRICSGGGPAGYLYPVERGAVVRRGGRATEWEADAACLRSCLEQLNHVVGEDIPPTPSESLEAALFSRWESINKEAKASSGGTYSRRQLRYLWKVCSELVKCKNLVVYDSHSAFRANLIQVTSFHQESVEDLIHILAIMLDQARDLYMNSFASTRSGLHFDRDLAAYRSKKWSKLKDYYDASSACLIDAVRRDPDLRRADFSDPLVTMKTILQWLHKGAKDDKKYLGPVLRPYLDGLFMASLENCWFLEDLEGRGMREMDGLKEYCMAVHDGMVEPCMGLLDAAKKYSWAKAMVDFVDRFRHVEFRVVFPTGDGMAVSYPARLPSRRVHSAARTLTLSRRDKEQAKLRLARRAVQAAFTLPHTTLKSKHLARHESEEILASVKSGNYWRNSTKPDIIPSSSLQELDVPRVRRSRRSRPATSYGFPEISITTDSKTMRRKYHTLKSLVYKEPVESIKQMRQRPRSAGSTMRNKEVLSRPSILETLDFINSVKDALCVEESGASDLEDSSWSLEEEWLVGQAAPLNVIAQHSGAGAPYLAGGDLVTALLDRGKFTILQELCSYLGEASEGALFALHRLARAARSRSSERMTSAWKLPEAEGAPAVIQKYKVRPPDYTSGDETPPPPPPLPRTSSMERHLKLSHDVAPRYSDYLPPARVVPPSPRLPQPPYTGIINPLYDIKMPHDKFSVKRSKSLGRSFSTRSLGLEITRYNVTLGQRSGKRTNDVVTAITDMTGETGLETKSNFFQKATADVVGDSYRISRVTID